MRAPSAARRLLPELATCQESSLSTLDIDLRTTRSLVLFLLASTACTTAATPPGATVLPVDAPAPTEPAPVEETPDPRLAGRPYTVHVPKNAGSEPLPLLLAFHGYGSDDDGETLEHFFDFQSVADTEGFLYVTPDGTKDTRGQRFWNGTDACCDFDDQRPDDVGYVRAIVADVAKHHALDPKRVFAFGLSGGGFFVHRLACDAADVFAGVVSMSGATWGRATKCKPAEPVAVAEIHGEADDLVPYEGGSFYAGSPTFPSAKETVARWARHDGCEDALTETSERHDLFPGLGGAETRVARHACTRGAAELWTVTKGGHAPAIGAAFAATTWRFLAAHPKP